MEKRGAGISYPMPNIKTAHLVSAADAGAHAGYGCRRNTDTTDRPLGSFFDYDYDITIYFRFPSLHGTMGIAVPPHCF